MTGTAGVIVVCGLLGLGLSQIDDNDDTAWLGDLFALSYCLLGVGGVLTFVCSVPVSFFYTGRRQETVLTTLNGLFDASSIGFSLYDRLHVYNRQTFSRRHWFIGLAIIAGITYSILLLLWCNRASQYKMIVAAVAQKSSVWTTSSSQPSAGVNVVDDTQRQQKKNNATDEVATLADRLRGGMTHVEELQKVQEHGQATYSAAEVESEVSAHVRQMSHSQWLSQQKYAAQLSSAELIFVVTFAAVHMYKLNSCKCISMLLPVLIFETFFVTHFAAMHHQFFLITKLFSPTLAMMTHYG
eukprot:SAG31_NODE_3525_length_4157_cov_5.449013_2_plen_298_part_00